MEGVAVVNMIVKVIGGPRVVMARVKANEEGLVDARYGIRSTLMWCERAIVDDSEVGVRSQGSQMRIGSESESLGFECQCPSRPGPTLLPRVSRFAHNEKPS